MPRYTVLKAGFFNQSYQDEKAVITLTEKQAKYHLLAGSIELTREDKPDPKPSPKKPSGD
ncbi:hypothetical protein [Chelatococcus asaccharovorans]|uniref:Uncharacterized protein n=1 Tax=Chelatococcus asaccharovorans TaxID=28210 RepID=A0A2V3UBR3_9HYPH|nr:hypothetical protein [Chelatococcus asaccharovorans]MBS7703318.1 hypothetical protein [Chelatococcus asaccharovorans]PXW61651.1 hypothetical protein C7450_103168 [Chelatococcus asaccharovorans]